LQSPRGGLRRQINIREFRSEQRRPADDYQWFRKSTTSIGVGEARSNPVAQQG
jgi:hypothetical protein